MTTKYTAIFTLRNMLAAAGIKYEFKDRSSKIIDFENYQIRVYEPKSGKQIISVIEGRGTYGEEENLLEIMGCLTPEEEKDDRVLGWLTAENVFERIVKRLQEADNGA